MMYKTNGMDEAVIRIDTNTNDISVGDLVEVIEEDISYILKINEIYHVLESENFSDKNTVKFVGTSIETGKNYSLKIDEIEKVYKEQISKTYDLIKALDNEECAKEYAEAFFEGFDEGEFEHE